MTVAASRAVRALEVITLGTLEYERALARQEAAVAAVLDGGTE